MSGQTGSFWGTGIIVSIHSVMVKSQKVTVCITKVTGKDTESHFAHKITVRVTKSHSEVHTKSRWKKIKSLWEHTALYENHWASLWSLSQVIPRAHNFLVSVIQSNCEGTQYQAKGVKESVNVTSQCEIHTDSLCIIHTDSLCIHPYLLSKSHNNHFDWIKSHCNVTEIHCEDT